MRLVFAVPGAARFFLAAAVGRIGIAMTSLGLIWLVHKQTGSYAIAGLVTGAFAVTEAVAGPVLARLVDRNGQSRVLPFALIAHGAAVAMLLTSVLSGARAWVLVLGGSLIGMTIPQLGALSAARWPGLLPAATLPSAFAMESVSNAMAHLVGPVVVSLLGALAHPALGTMLAAVLVLGGGWCFAIQRKTAPLPTGRREVKRDLMLLRPRLLALIAANIAIGGFFGAMQVSVTAFAVQRHEPGLAAGLFALANVASLSAGLLFSMRRWRITPSMAAAGLAVGAMPALFGGFLPVALAIALTGLVIPVLLALNTTLASDLAGPGVLTQALTWINSASVAGAALSASFAGHLADRYGAQGAFATGVLCAFLCACFSVGRMRSPM